MRKPTTFVSRRLDLPPCKGLPAAPSVPKQACQHDRFKIARCLSSLARTAGKQEILVLFGWVLYARAAVGFKNCASLLFECFQLCGLKSHPTRIWMLTDLSVLILHLLVWIIWPSSSHHLNIQQYWCVCVLFLYVSGDWQLTLWEPTTVWGPKCWL